VTRFSPKKWLAIKPGHFCILNFVIILLASAWSAPAQTTNEPQPLALKLSTSGTFTLSNDLSKKLKLPGKIHFNLKINLDAKPVAKVKNRSHARGDYSVTLSDPANDRVFLDLKTQFDIEAEGNPSAAAARVTESIGSMLKGFLGEDFLHGTNSASANLGLSIDSLKATSGK
jgi:hypothetical protein